MTRKKEGVFAALLLIAVLVLGCALCAGMSVSADHSVAGSAAAEEICIYQTVLVCEGDTLWSIACEYRQASHSSSIDALVRDLRRINGLSGNTIYAGSTIVVPVYQAEE